MQPIYVTQSSTGSSPWKLINWHVTPINLGITVVSAGSTGWQIDVTMADPTGTYLSTAGVTVFSASGVGGPAPATSTNAFIGAVLQPIAAWRLTNNSTTGAVTATVVQAGIG